jgi:hypothetical protein
MYANAKMKPAETSRNQGKVIGREVEQGIQV